MPLKFLARGTAMCPRFDAPTIRGFAGRKFDPAINGWPKNAEPFSSQSADAEAEFLLACRRGDLWPADKATADACGVPFDPKFGGDVELQPAPKAKD